MSLGLANEIAKSALAANSISSSVISRNIANVSSAFASRKSANVGTTANGGVAVDSVTNSIDAALFETVVVSNARVAELSATSSALTTLAGSVGDPQSEISINASMVQLKAALQAATSAPQDESMARSVLSAAQATAGRLNEAGALIDKVRAGANTDIAAGVQQLSDLLAKFETVNGQVVSGTVLGRDVTDQVDQRNDLLYQISRFVDVHPAVRGAQDMVLFAANGTTLFETVPRKVTFDSKQPLSPGQSGSVLRIDGIPFSGAQGSKLGGLLGGALQVRDVIALQVGRQLDEEARGLIQAFAETDQSVAASAPALAGLFTYAGGPGLPATGTLVDGLARSIKVNANADPAQGGTLARLRDGGISAPGDARYVYNAAAASGYTGRLRQMVSVLDAPMSFDQAAQTGIDKSVLRFSADSAGWLEGQRSSALAELQQKQIRGERATSVWQSAVGINLDEELTNLMSLEKSFQASSRLISTVNSMFDVLLQMAR